MKKVLKKKFIKSKKMLQMLNDNLISLELELEKMKSENSHNNNNNNNDDNKK